MTFIMVMALLREI